MNCLKCGGTYIEKSDVYKLNDPYVGLITISGIPYYKCDNCGDILYSESMAREIESVRYKRIHSILSRLPISDFISAADTASLLGISRQALHKNRRINHGFIYHDKFFGQIVYLKESVNQYKKTDDGRFPLHLHETRRFAKYTQNFVNIGILPIYERYPSSLRIGRPFTKTSSLGQKEYTYAN